jgi:hypothetical protein
MTPFRRALPTYRAAGGKILEGWFLAEVLHAHSVLFFRQEKNFQDHS